MKTNQLAFIIAVTEWRVVILSIVLKIFKHDHLFTVMNEVKCFQNCLLFKHHRAGFSWWEAWGPWWEAWAQWRISNFSKGLAIELQGFKNEGFGGRPPVGGRPGARGPRAPTKSGPAIGSTLSVFFKFV